MCALSHFIRWRKKRHFYIFHVVFKSILKRSWMKSNSSVFFFIFIYAAVTQQMPPVLCLLQKHETSDFSNAWGKKHVIYYILLAHSILSWNDEIFEHLSQKQKHSYEVDFHFVCKETEVIVEDTAWWSATQRREKHPKNEMIQCRIWLYKKPSAYTATSECVTWSLFSLPIFPDWLQL